MEIIIPILACITAVAGSITAVSETLPFMKKYSANGLLHGIWHMIHPEKCINESESSESIGSLVEAELGLELN